MLSEVGTRLGGYSQSFGYDNSGNPTTFKGTGQTFNSDNQRSAAGYVFDGNGNPTTYAGTTFTYDPENRVTGIGASWSATYRADGLRAKKTVSGASTYYLYDGGVPVIEMNGSGATTAVNAFGPDGLVARQQSGSWIQYQFDQQGNVAQRLNATQSVLSSSVYDAYGVESNAGGTPTDPFAYNGQSGYVLDRETGMYACAFRYYDPAQGRFVNRDPIGSAGGVNLYGYAASSPISRSDPSGLYVFSIFGNDFDFSLDSIGQGLATSAAAFARGVIRPLDSAIDGSSGLGILGELAGIPRSHITNDLFAGVANRPGIDESEIAWGVAGTAIDGIGYCNAASSPRVGSLVFRVFGGKSGPYGSSWTTTNPLKMRNPRAALGLPDVNSGAFAVEGVVADPTGIVTGRAKPLDGNPGGAVEWVIPDPQRQVIIIGGGGFRP